MERTLSWCLPWAEAFQVFYGKGRLVLLRIEDYVWKLLSSSVDMGSRKLIQVKDPKYIFCGSTAFRRYE